MILPLAPKDVSSASVALPVAVLLLLDVVLAVLLDELVEEIVVIPVRTA